MSTKPYTLRQRLADEAGAKALKADKRAEKAYQRGDTTAQKLHARQADRAVAAHVRHDRKA